MKLKEKFIAKDNPKLKQIADYLLYVLLPFIQTSLAIAQAQNIISLKQAFWAGLATSFFIVNTKFITKFSTDKNPQNDTTTN